LATIWAMLAPKARCRVQITPWRRHMKNFVLAAVSASALLALSACGEAAEEPVATEEVATEVVEEAAVDAVEAVDAAAVEGEAAVDAAAAEGEAAVEAAPAAAPAQ